MYWFLVIPKALHSTAGSSIPCQQRFHKSSPGQRPTPLTDQFLALEAAATTIAADSSAAATATAAAAASTAAIAASTATTPPPLGVSTIIRLRKFLISLQNFVHIDSHNVHYPIYLLLCLLKTAITARGSTRNRRPTCRHLGSWPLRRERNHFGGLCRGSERGGWSGSPMSRLHLPASLTDWCNIQSIRTQDATIHFYHCFSSLIRQRKVDKVKSFTSLIFEHHLGTAHFTDEETEADKSEVT
ncbi:uncharacterized protein [Notamacropus eugenii]|uniref:uncharacterized protein n=1 Tax=Notamacropus eugenii TaxID=9315 RepID=UPI003B67F24D